MQPGTQRLRWPRGGGGVGLGVTWAAGSSLVCHSDHVLLLSISLLSSSSAASSACGCSCCTSDSSAASFHLDAVAARLTSVLGRPSARATQPHCSLNYCRRCFPPFPPSSPPPPATCSLQDLHDFLRVATLATATLPLQLPGIPGQIDTRLKRGRSRRRRKKQQERRFALVADGD